MRKGSQTIVGWTSSDGDIGVSAYDQESGDTQSTVLDPAFEVDDHSSPAIFVRDDDRLVLFWTEHNTQTIYWKISETPSDVSSFGPLKSFDTASAVNYPQPVPWDGGIRLYYRYGSGDSSVWAYRDSTDGASSFGARQTLFDDASESWNYIHPYVDSNKLHFAMGDHRMETPGIYHWYLEDGTYYESGGTEIQSASSAITAVSDVTTVYDGGASGNNPPKQYDLQTDSNGNPVVVFTEHVETGSGGGDGDYRARWAKWDGSQWVVGAEITAMGGAMPENHYYEGGLSLDSQDPTTVYVSVEQDSRNYQIQEWTTNDGGSTWSKVRDRSRGVGTITNPTKRGRPISPRDHDGSVSVLWFEGKYGGFTNYLTRIQRDTS